MVQTRREFIKNASVSAVSLSLSRLSFDASAQSGGVAPATVEYGDWRDVYKNKWTWDKVVSSTHSCNCNHNCSWKLYVKEGIVWREEQNATYKHLHKGLADDNPQGCQKGAAFSNQMYSENRLRYPLKRVGERGSRNWKRVSWDEALTDIAKSTVEVVRDEGADRIIIPMATQGTAAKSRYANAIGGVVIEPYGDIGDAHNGASMTTGTLFHNATSDSRMMADCIIMWIYNPSSTRIADAHHLSEARYGGTTIVSVSPDQNPSHMHADYWVNPEPGTDHGMALAMAHIIVRDNLYDEGFLREQTDMPFLVRMDNKKFLRASDFEADGSDEVFYVWDRKTNKAVQPPGSMGSADKTLILGDTDPALEGKWQVNLASGESVEVTTVFELMKLSLAGNTPEYGEKVTGVGAKTLEKIAAIYANSETALIQCGWGMPKIYHGDLLQRAIFLLSALTGNTGKVGGGVFVGGIVESGSPITFPTKYFNGKHRVIPGATWLYVHGGLNKVSSRWTPVPGEKTADEYIMEGLEKGWMPIWPKPGEDPRILIECGSNLLRRTRMNHVLRENLWPKLKLVVTIDFHMSSSALESDYVLPAAGYYESSAIKYSDSASPYHVMRQQAVEPIAESRQEWWIFAELCKRIQKMAPGMGITQYEDKDLGLTRDLSDIYDVYTENGKYPEDVDTMEFVKLEMATSPAYKGIDFEEFRDKGQVNWVNEGGRRSPTSRATYEFTPGTPHADSSDQVSKKMPWFTLTGRTQFYLDHDWFLEFGEELPVYVPPPAMGGDHPFRLTCGHARWSIHSFMRDNELMLRLQRGEPIMYMNDEDAAERGIEDHEIVEVFNDVGSFKVHIKTTPLMQRYQLHSYHAWERYMFTGGHSHAAVQASQIKPLGMVGNYGHLKYSVGFYQPTNVDKGARADVRRLAG